MKTLLLFLAVSALGNVFYHVAMKSFHTAVNPMMLLAADRRVWLLTAGVVLIEPGCLLA